MQPLPVNDRMTGGGQYLNLFDSRSFKTIGDPLSSLSDIIGMLRQTGDAGDAKKLTEFVQIAGSIVF
jgi:hypothetical protein